MRLVDESLVEMIDGQPTLIGGRRRSDGQIVFPRPTSPDFDPVHLSREGKLWSWTVQRFPPKPPYIAADRPNEFVPYAVGYVELPELIVEAHLDTRDFESLEIGQPMRLTIYPFARDAEGQQVFIYAFAPTAEKIQ